MKYTKASAEVVLFDNSDVITTSYGTGFDIEGCDSKTHQDWKDQGFGNWCDTGWVK